MRAAFTTVQRPSDQDEYASRLFAYQVMNSIKGSLTASLNELLQPLPETQLSIVEMLFLLQHVVEVVLMYSCSQYGKDASPQTRRRQAN